MQTPESSAQLRTLAYSCDPLGNHSEGETKEASFNTGTIWILVMIKMLIWSPSSPKTLQRYAIDHVVILKRDLIQNRESSDRAHVRNYIRYVWTPVTCDLCQVQVQ